MKSALDYCAWWRTTEVRDRQVVDAIVVPEHRGPSRELARALERWPGPHYWARGDGEGRLVLIRILKQPKAERWWLHTMLFVVTFATVWMGGALLAGGADAAVPFSTRLSTAEQVLSRWLAELSTWGSGLDFALALMAILLAHESGHYIIARRYGINASPPYFLPAPPWWNFIGTFGAFIRLRSPIVDRRQLMDVGAAGPWAGFLVAVVALLVGLGRSQIVPEQGPSSQLIVLADLRLYLGDSPIMYAARQLIVGEGTVQLHPLAFAGWIGLLVTMLNLVPLGQLDGGHVLYALIGRWQARIGPLVWLALIALGFIYLQWWWWVWATLILVLGRGRLAHPEVLDRHRPLPPSRRPLGWATVLLFAATFIPVPIHY
ncbi:MAG: site-2 protease family protein [Gemmatimonadales bacterium]